MFRIMIGTGSVPILTQPREKKRRTEKEKKEKTLAWAAAYANSRLLLWITLRVRPFAP